MTYTDALAARHHAWKKCGHIYSPSGERPWARTHAANPIAQHQDGDLFRIYFSSRDERNRSSIGYILIDLRRPHEIIEESPEPVLPVGDLGMFDDSGVSIGCLVDMQPATYLYYMGWNLAVTVPWKNAVGLAISEGPGEPFRRHSRFPVMPLDEIDPYTISYPWIIEDEGVYRMWYGTSLTWGATPGDMCHVIKYAESVDCIHWKRDTHIAVNQTSTAEYALCKPCVVKDPDAYRMWFCSRGDTYRIQLAESKDGFNWERKGQDPGIDVSRDGWDSEMIEYPCVFDHKGQRYLLYSGNDYGRTGFGLAVLETRSAQGSR